ncbi:MAG: DUF106 domain-containing protein [archaeon]|nr:MAG: DUF106 domain-containing protein [archaeon]
MSSKNSRAPKGQRRPGLALLLVGVVGVALLANYVIVPYLFPPALPGPAVSLAPSTDLAGSIVTIGGKELAPNQTVTATYDNASLSLSGTCKTDPKGSLAGCTFIVPQSSVGPHLVAVNDTVRTTLAHFSIPGIRPPESTLIVTLTSVGLGLVTQFVTRRFVNLDAERKMKAELADYNKEKREATLAKDKARLEKLARRDLAMKQTQSKIQTARLKVTGITIVPLLGVYYLMAFFLGGLNVTVAFSPYPIPYLVNPNGTMALFWWYILSSFTFSGILSKLLRTTT